MAYLSTQPLISVIVPVFNSASTLERCVRSILSQTYTKLEIILINDGSNDDSFALCKKLSESDSRIVVLSQKNGGAGAARNAGLKAMHGDYIGFCDSDDYIESTMYERLLEALVQCRADVSCCGRVDHYGSIFRPGLSPAEKTTLSGVEALRNILNYAGMDFAPCDKLFSKKGWGAALFPEGRICEDIGCLYGIFKKVTKVSLINERLYHYCHRSSSASEIRLGPRAFDFQYYANMVYRDVLAEVSSLEPEATRFRIKSLMYTIGFIYRATKKEYLPFRADLYSFVDDVRSFFPKMKMKQKTLATLYLCRALRSVRPMYKFFAAIKSLKNNGF